MVMTIPLSAKSGELKFLKKTFKTLSPAAPRLYQTIDLELTILSIQILMEEMTATTNPSWMIQHSRSIDGYNQLLVELHERDILYQIEL